MKYIIIIIALLLSGCAILESNEQTDRRRIRKAAHRSPQLFQNDTVWQTLTVPVEKVTLDSFIVVETLPGDCPDLDSLELYNSDSTARVIIRQVIKWRDSIRIDSFPIYVECLPDPVSVKVPTSTSTTVDARPGMGLKNWLFLIAGVLVLILTVRIVRR
jgi:hypothetical protein